MTNDRRFAYVVFSSLRFNYDMSSTKYGSGLTFCSAEDPRKRTKDSITVTVGRLLMALMVRLGLLWSALISFKGCVWSE